MHPISKNEPVQPPPPRHSGERNPHFHVPTLILLYKPSRTFWMPWHLPLCYSAVEDDAAASPDILVAWCDAVTEGNRCRAVSMTSRTLRSSTGLVRSKSTPAHATHMMSNMPRAEHSKLRTSSKILRQREHCESATLTGQSFTDFVLIFLERIASDAANKQRHADSSNPAESERQYQHCS